jgi:phytoene synthase
MTTLAPESGAKTSNLAFALMFLPKARRDDALLFYRFCRTIDDIADAGGRSDADTRLLLDEWMSAIDSQNLPGGLEEMIARHTIDRNLLAEIVRGCSSDVGAVRFATFGELEKYCWRVACAVGLVSIRIFGCRSPSAAGYAENLGHALQLTNILRDVGEDAAMGRIYLPREDLDRFGVSEDDLLSRRSCDGFLPLMRFEAGRARTRFAAAILPRADAKALISSEIMRALYVRILDRLEKENFPALDRCVRLGRLEKIRLAFLAATRTRLGFAGD